MKPYKINKHLWKREKNGDIDIFAFERGFHNGPVCKACGEAFCHHCHPECYESECKIGYYECENCHGIVGHGDKFCKSCGQPIDWTDTE
jgi:hypothetical protein